jgi:rsbT co-antagonist protein RsbR
MRTWLQQIPITDPTQRPFAELLQIMLLALLAMLPPALVLITVTTPDAALRLTALALISLMAGTFGGAIALVRRGYVQLAFVISALVLMLTGFLNLLGQGFQAGSHFVILLTLPLTLSALLGSRAVIGGLAALAVLMMGAVVVLEQLGSPLVGWQTFSGEPGIAAMVNVVLAMGVVIFFLGRFRAALRVALVESQARERALTELSTGLEQTIAARTAALQASVDQLRMSQETIRDIGAPMLPVLPGVLVAPLIGIIDSARATALSERVLTAVAEHRAAHVLLDLTGVGLVDTQVAQALLNLTAAVRLLGARPALVGIRAEVAATLVRLNLPLGDVHVYPRLQEAVVELAPDISLLPRLAQANETNSGALGGYVRAKGYDEHLTAV